MAMTTLLRVVRRVEEAELRLEGIGGLRHLVHGVLLVLVLMHRGIDRVTLVRGRLDVADCAVWKLFASVGVNDGSALEGSRLSVLQGIVDDRGELRVLLESWVLGYFDSIGTLGQELRDHIDVVSSNSVVKGGESCLVACINVERRLVEERADELGIAILGGLEECRGHDGVVGQTEKIQSLWQRQMEGRTKA